MVAGSSVVNIKAGKILIHENEKSRKMYIVKEGSVRVFKTYMGQKITLAVLGAGEIFGELSFFDAEPRTASVEAISDLVVVVIDGSQDIDGLPNWVMPIFKTIVHRFRDADQKITQLQSMYEFQKRSQKTDKLAQNIYLELQRFIKTLNVLYADKTKSSTDINTEEFHNDFKEMLGECRIGLKDFWDSLKKHNFIDEKAQAKGKLDIDMNRISNFNEYLRKEVESERYLILSHTSIAILNKILSYGNSEASAPSDDGSVKSTVAELNIDKIPLYEEGLKELKDSKVMSAETDKLAGNSQEVADLYTFQCLLKSFDHTNVMAV